MRNVVPLSKLVLLASLYLAQGLPFGFFTQSLPVLLRQQGVSLAWIGSSFLLAAPWALKFLWAPYVDRYGSARFGWRRTWIVPLQLLSALLLAVLSQYDVKLGLGVLFGAVFCANLFAATQDIATDALAVELLPERERGLGNGVQVAGFRLGMIVGGGLMLVLFDDLGHAVGMLLMAAMLLVLTLPVAFHREPVRSLDLISANARAGAPFSLLWSRIGHPKFGAWLLVLVACRGADFGTPMLRPLLVDRGSSLTDIGWLTGTAGALAGLAGALFGGIRLRSMQRSRALGSFCAIHGLSLLLYGIHAQAPFSTPALYAAVGVEQFTGGMATVALFTAMMDRCEPETAGTDYTLQASLVAGSTGILGIGSGLSAQVLGYPVHFALASALAVCGAFFGYTFLAREEAHKACSRAVRV